MYQGGGEGHARASCDVRAVLLWVEVSQVHDGLVVSRERSPAQGALRVGALHVREARGCGGRARRIR